MANKINICNSALDKLGVENITALTDGTKASNLCSRNYDVLRKKLLRTHWWNFATKRVTLTAESTTPEWGFNSEFLLPSDNVRFLQLENPEIRHRIEDGKLLLEEAYDTVNILYIFDQDDVDSMSDTFKIVKAVGGKLHMGQDNINNLYYATEIQMGLFEFLQSSQE